MSTEVAAPFKGWQEDVWWGNVHGFEPGEEEIIGLYTAATMDTTEETSPESFADPNVGAQCRTSNREVRGNLLSADNRWTTCGRYHTRSSNMIAET